MGILAISVLATNMNGDLPLLDFNASSVARLMISGVGIGVNVALAVLVRKYRVPAIIMAFIYTLLASFFYYAFVIKQGAYLGFWIF